MTKLHTDWCYRKIWKYASFIAIVNWGVWGIGFRITGHWDRLIYWDAQLGPLNLWMEISLFEKVGASKVRDFMKGQK